MAALLLATGCSSFDRAWNAAGEAPPGGAVAPMSGPWIGTWRSDVNGHHDRLRCLVEPGTNRTFSARFHARYKKAFFRFSFGYTVHLTVRTNDGRIEFEGDADLGWYAGGTYRYRGFATGTNLHSTYDSKYDRGVFSLHRPVTRSETR
jgi:hypothetical protein